MMAQKEHEKIEPIPARKLQDIARFMRQDADLWVFRRFELLHIVNVLALEERLSRLEQDFFDISNYETAQANGDEDFYKPQKTRARVLNQIQAAIKAYGIVFVF